MDNKEQESNVTNETGETWKNNFPEKYPWISRLVSNIISSSIAAISAGLIVTYWAGNNLPPNGKARVEQPTAQSAIPKIIVENLGYMPAYDTYTVASPPTQVANSYSIDTGKEYIELKDTKDKHIKRLIIKRLPRSEKVQINIIGSGQVTITKE